MFILIAFLLLLAISLLLLIHWYRKDKKSDTPVVSPVDDGCCGAHEVCEKESLLNAGDKIVYYEDEELDILSGVQPHTYTPEQIDLFSDVFYTLKESDVAGWLRSLQLRKIELPQEIKDAAFLIVSERRKQH